MDLLLNELNVDEIDSLKRDIWLLLWIYKVKFLEILLFICGLSENDIDEIILVVKNRIQNDFIDNFYEVLRRRNFDCFKSFLVVFFEYEYGNLWMVIMEIGKKKLLK